MDVQSLSIISGPVPSSLLTQSGEIDDPLTNTALCMARNELKVQLWTSL